MAVPEHLLMRALAAAERRAVEHVKFLRHLNVPLSEAAEAIGLDPANVRGWDDVTMGYACRARDMFDRMDAAFDADRGRGV